MLDWGQLDLACAFYGVQDREALIESLLQIKHHQRPGEGREQDEDSEPEEP